MDIAKNDYHTSKSAPKNVIMTIVSINRTNPTIFVDTNDKIYVNLFTYMKTQNNT